LLYMTAGMVFETGETDEECHSEQAFLNEIEGLLIKFNSVPLNVGISRLNKPICSPVSPVSPISPSRSKSSPS
jgi:hypothetical protein